MESQPEVLVVGTGYSGLMKVLPETREYVTSRGIELMVQKTGEAWRAYNFLSTSQRVVGAFHLTC